MNSVVETLMLDCGAFSVWNSGQEINLENYIAFAKEHQDGIDVIVALDVIPGLPGNKQSLTKKNIAKACEQGWKNYKRMIDAGLPKEKVMPVFHQNDDWKWLEKFMENEIPYFGISPANDSSSYHRQMWLDNCMSIVCDKEGMPLVKFHGFAVTSIPLMVRYPWYSCDSASWLMHSVYGVLMLPHRKTDGSWDFLRSPLTYSFSTKIGKKGKGRGEHYKFLSPHVRKAMEEYVEMTGVKIGKSKYRREHRKYKHDAHNENIFERHEDHLIIEEIVEHGVTNDHRFRCLANQFYFETVEKLLEWPRPFKRKGKGLL